MDTPLQDIFEKYKKEIELDTAVDEINIKDVQLKLPAIKHKWVARLIHAKSDLKRLQSARWTALEQIKNPNTPPVRLPEDNKMAAASKQAVVVRIDQQISQQELIIEYLTKVEVIMKSMTYDLANAIKIIQLETT